MPHAFLRACDVWASTLTCVRAYARVGAKRDCHCASVTAHACVPHLCRACGTGRLEPEVCVNSLEPCVDRCCGARARAAHVTPRLASAPPVVERAVSTRVDDEVRRPPCLDDEMLAQRLYVVELGRAARAEREQLARVRLAARAALALRLAPLGKPPRRATKLRGEGCSTCGRGEILRVPRCEESHLLEIRGRRDAKVKNRGQCDASSRDVLLLEEVSETSGEMCGVKANYRQPLGTDRPKRRRTSRSRGHSERCAAPESTV
eukprot:1096309-Pleurochrysis_carterae.AAC.1